MARYSRTRSTRGRRSGVRRSGYSRRGRVSRRRSGYRRGNARQTVRIVLEHAAPRTDIGPGVPGLVGVSAVPAGPTKARF